MIYLGVLITEYFVLYKLSRDISKNSFRVFYGLTRSEKASIYIYSLLFLPGTFVHEMSHFITSLFLLVPVKDLDLVPQIEDGRLKMGSVKVAKTDPIRTALIGISPFIIGNLILFLIIKLTLDNNFTDSWIFVALAVYAVFQIGNTMFSSREDMSVAIKLMIVLVLIYAALYLLGLRISFDPESILTGKVLEYVKLASWLLLIPIAIDLLIVFLLKLVRKVFPF